MFGNTKELEKKVDGVTETVAETNKLINKFLADLDVAMKNLNTESIKNSAWSKEFHRLLINQISENQTQGRVYLLLYYHPVLNVRRPLLTVADTLENAMVIGENALRNAQENPAQWVIESNQFINVPKQPLTVEEVSKVDKKVSPNAKPAEVFINDIQLIQEKFAQTPVEKRALTNIIKKIRLAYSITDSELV